jgi:DNA-binding response OmpR family regulator
MEAREKGAYDYIIKPIELPDLLVKIYAAIEKQRME